MTQSPTLSRRSASSAPPQLRKWKQRGADARAGCTFLLPWLLGFLALAVGADEAARIAGAGRARIFTSTMLPLMKPALISTSTFSVIWSWNDFLGPLFYLTTPQTSRPCRPLPSKAKRSHTR